MMHILGHCTYPAVTPFCHLTSPNVISTQRLLNMVLLQHLDLRVLCRVLSFFVNFIVPLSSAKLFAEYTVQEFAGLDW